MIRTSAVEGLPRIRIPYQICPCCMAGQQHRERFPRKSETRADKPGQRIHSDLIGPMQVTSLGGSRYTLVFTDDYSRKGWIYFMRSKSETLTKFREFQRRIENETSNKIQILCTDRGGEYLSDEFSKLCKESGIKRELTQAHTPQQNGVSERRNRTIVERAHSMSSDCRLPTYLWSEAISHAQYLINRSPTRANRGSTPEAKYTGKIPNISNLRIFGCVAYVHVPKERRRKLDSKTI